jgi:hypothetical protein
MYTLIPVRRKFFVIRTVAQKQHVWTNTKYRNASPAFWVMVMKKMAVDKTKVLWRSGGQEHRSHRMYPSKPIVYCSFTKHKT